MRRSNGASKSRTRPDVTLTHDTMCRKNIAELALCHVAELIDLAQDIACNMHSGVTCLDVTLHASGRIATLTHCAKRELEEARLTIAAL